MLDCVLKFLFDANSQHNKALVKPSSANEIVRCNCSHLIFCALEAETN